MYRDHPQIDQLMSIAIFILVYFIILSTFCAGRKSIEITLDKPGEVIDHKINAGNK